MLLKNLINTTVVLAFSVTIVLAQEVIPTPTPPEQTVKVVTEEVQVNVMAQNRFGRFEANLTKEDLLVVEDGVPQEITSLRRIPANVLLLLDTGGELNFVKTSKLTGFAAKLVLKNLKAEDYFAVLQYNSKIESVSDWSNNKDDAFAAIDKKLFSGKRSKFAEALNEAVKTFQNRPTGNRHLVLISDGMESVANEIEREKALQNLLVQNITVHIISYTQLEAQIAQTAGKRLKLGNGTKKQAIPPEIEEQILLGLPVSQRATFKAMIDAPPIVIFDLDTERLKFIRKRREGWLESEANLQDISEKSGGIFFAPETLETLLTFGSKIAGAIDSQYVLTYLPKRQFADSPNGETRKIRVSSSCVGVEIKARNQIYNTLTKDAR
jgi:VWFA-related protein